MLPKTTRSKKSKQRSTNTFRSKVSNANEMRICNSSNPSLLNLRQILKKTIYQVPIFQRRYCWSVKQWKTLLADARGIHSLGRLTCTNTKPRSIVLDGQQRFTTVTILLASLRDALKKKDDPLISFINKLLFPDVEKMNIWIQEENKVFEGIELPFSVLIPTFCDRWSYYSAILPNQVYNEKNSSWHRPMQAKKFFDSHLANLGRKHIHSLYNCVLDGFNMLFFPIEISKGYQDGTEDLMIIYERLALRDTTFCKPTRNEEYEPMGAIDLIRNLFLGTFQENKQVIVFYQNYWLPMERASETSTKSMHEMLETFLKTNTLEDFSPMRQETIIGGELYADFQAWLDVAMDEKENEKESVDLESKIMKIGQLILNFSIQYFQESKKIV